MAHQTPCLPRVSKSHSLFGRDKVTEPSDSLDPVDWLVWGDFLSDQGNELAGERARNIGRGLRLHPEGLYLVYVDKDRLELELERYKEPALSGCCYGTPLDDSSVLDFYNQLVYSFSPVSPSPTYSTGEVFPISPPHFPRVFSTRPDLIPLFWDKLAELGGQK